MIYELAKNLLEELSVQIILLVAAAIIGYLIRFAKDKIDEKKFFKKGIMTALDCCYDAEKELSGKGRGEERFRRAVQLYMQRTGENLERAGSIVHDAFNVTHLCHNSEIQSEKEQQ